MLRIIEIGEYAVPSGTYPYMIFSAFRSHSAALFREHIRDPLQRCIWYIAIYSGFVGLAQS